MPVSGNDKTAKDAEPNRQADHYDLTKSLDHLLVNRKGRFFWHPDVNRSGLPSKTECDSDDQGKHSEADEEGEDLRQNLSCKDPGISQLGEPEPIGVDAGST